MSITKEKNKSKSTSFLDGRPALMGIYEVKKGEKNAAIISFNYSEEREKGVAIKKEKRIRTKTNLSEK